MVALSLFNSLCKWQKVFGLLVLGAFLIVGRGFAAEIQELSIDWLEGDCGVILELRLLGQFRGTTDDDDNRDEITFLLYDGNGLILLYEPFSLSDDIENSIELDIYDSPTARPFTLLIYDTDFDASSPAEATTYPLLGSLSFDPASYGVCEDLPFVMPSQSANDSAGNPRFLDARLNNYDMAAPVVAYGHDFENGRGLVVYSPDGALLLEVHPEALAAVAECPEENTLIAASGNVALYRLPNCDFQLNAPSLDGVKTYVLIFGSLYNTGYISYEE